MIIFNTTRFEAPVFRMPKKLINLELAKQYCIGDSAVIHEKGDCRCLYLAWLYSIEMDEIEEEFEPPVPPGLKNLCASFESFVVFMRIDDDLITVSAAACASEYPLPTDDKKLKSWIKNLPSNKKDEIIFRLINENNPHLGNELQQEFQNELSDKGTKKKQTKMNLAALLTCLKKLRHSRKKGSGV